MPLAIEPTARLAIRTPESDLTPSWSAKATSAISRQPRIAPTAAPTTKRTRSPLVRMAEGPCRASWPCGGGSVRPWAANSRLPTAARVNAVTTPLVACPVVERNVTSTGPTMKTNSSTTDSIASAVGRRWLPRSRWVHRTRIIDETGGMHAPASPAETKTVHSGQSSFTAARKLTPAATKTTSTGSRTRRWPWVSAQRRTGGGGGDRAGRGDRAAEAVGARLVGDQQHAAQADHRQRQPSDERGEHHRQGVRGAQHLQVGIRHERESLQRGPPPTDPSRARGGAWSRPLMRYRHANRHRAAPRRMIRRAGTAKGPDRCAAVRAPIGRA